MSDIVKQDAVFGSYYNRINSLILKTKQNVIKNINYEMVELYYSIGSTINELIEEYHLEASQNKILKSFSEKLTREFGEGYSVPNLKLMKKFYLTYKDGYTLCNQLSWRTSNGRKQRNPRRRAGKRTVDQRKRRRKREINER